MQTRSGKGFGHGRWRRSALAAVLALGAAAGPFAGTAFAREPIQSVFTYYDEHPCKLLSQNQVSAVFGVPVEAGSPNSSTSGGGSCGYSGNLITRGPMRGTLAGVDFGFALGTAQSERGTLTEVAGSRGQLENLPSFGAGAFCILKGFDRGALYATVGTFTLKLDGKPFSSAVYLNVGGDNACYYSVILARDAFARLG